MGLCQDFTFAIHWTDITEQQQLWSWCTRQQQRAQDHKDTDTLGSESLMEKTATVTTRSWQSTAHHV